MTLPKIHKLARYIISGGTAASVTLGSSFVFTSLFHVWYLASSVIAFCLGFIVSFIFQKFWTFDHQSLDDVHKEVGMYLAVGLTNVGINTFLMYSMVDIFGIWYLLAQFISAGLVALISFPIYNKIIFKHKLKT